MITTRTLVSYVGAVDEPLEFCEMANKWLGFQPKANVAGLIVAREIFRLHTKNVLIIQSALRRKFAQSRYVIVLSCLVLSCLVMCLVLSCHVMSED